MGWVERLREQWPLARAAGRLVFDAPWLLPSGKSNPAKRVQHWAQKTPDAPALLFEDERYTWKQLNDRANAYVAFFAARGIQAGDVVAVLLENQPDYLFAVNGLSKLGAVAALINTNLTGKSLQHAIGVDQVEIALSIAGFHVAETVPLFR